MDVLILRFDAPLMSFGAPVVDRHGVVQPYPALSLVTGLLANALGYDHREHERIGRLQERLRYASRQDRRGRRIRDYQTVDLSKPYMNDARAWTTRGELETRKGGTASSGTHIRLRDYWADAIHTVALTLAPLDEEPTLADVSHALQAPARPLFIGRKTCLPAAFLHTLCMKARDLNDYEEPGDFWTDVLRHIPLAEGADAGPHAAWWPSHPDHDEPEADMQRPVTDRRDWANQIHVGSRWIAHGQIEIKPDDAHD